MLFWTPVNCAFFSPTSWDFPTSKAKELTSRHSEGLFFVLWNSFCSRGTLRVIVGGQKYVSCMSCPSWSWWHSYWKAVTSRGALSWLNRRTWERIVLLALRQLWAQWRAAGFKTSVFRARNRHFSNMPALILGNFLKSYFGNILKIGVAKIFPYYARQFLHPY